MSDDCVNSGAAAAASICTTPAGATDADAADAACRRNAEGGGGFSVPVLRVEQLKEEGLSSACTSEEESDTEIVNRLGEFVAPTDELAAKIVTQIEFYFSDANIVKDAFLLKHVRRNKHGYVNLKLITSFKKMKALTKDYRVVAFSVRKLSDKLEVNDEGNKVRRTAALPDYDETTPSRTVVVSNLPSESPSVESVADLFKDCGEIALVRILRPGKPLPPDVKKQLSKHPDSAVSSVIALVEFERHEGASLAVAKAARDSSRCDWRNSLCVTPLVLPSPAASPSSGGAKLHKKKMQPNDSSVGAGERPSQVQSVGLVAALQSVADGNVADGFSSGSEDVGMRSRGSSFGSEPPRSRNNSLGGRPSPFSSSPGVQRRRNPIGTSPLAVGSGGTEEKRGSPRASPGGSPEMRRRHSSGAGAAGTGNGADGVADSTSVTPTWMQRRMAQGRDISPLAKLSSAANGSGNGSGSSSPSMARKMANEEILIRLPRGPDGTRGFHRSQNGGGSGTAMPVIEVAPVLVAGEIGGASGDN